MQIHNPCFYMLHEHHQYPNSHHTLAYHWRTGCQMKILRLPDINYPHNVFRLIDPIKRKYHMNRILYHITIFSVISITYIKWCALLLPEQSSVVHFFSRIPSPLQCFPNPDWAGAVHVLVLNMIPLPQVTLQSPQELQCVHAPSTVGSSSQ